jgi:hypothetical protein
LPNWVIAVVLPVPAAPDRMSPRRALTACRFSSVSRRPFWATDFIVGVAITVNLVW